jgi:Cu-Zn family superoxide dismutase
MLLGVRVSKHAWTFRLRTVKVNFPYGKGKRMPRTLRTGRLLIGVVVIVVVVAGVGLLLMGFARARENTPVASATLRLADGRQIGRVDFFDGHPGTVVRATIALPPGSRSATTAFHGFHIHANDDATNGNNCMADPKQPSKTWFVSADGHFDHGKHTHGTHDGDMSSVFVTAGGRGTLEFRTDRLSPADLDRRVVIVHAGPDNFGNVPVGTASTEYTPNSAAATEATAKTGNSGDRIACGVIEMR